MNRTKTILATAAAGAALIAWCIGMRPALPAPLARGIPKRVVRESERPNESEQSSPSGRDPVMVESSAAAADLHDPEIPSPGFWEEIGRFIGGEDAADREKRRHELLERTTGYLGLEGARAEGFKIQARQAAGDLDWAWCARDAAILTLPPGDEEREEAIQKEYEARKSAALARLEIAVGESPRSEEFRARLEEWIDAVR